MARSSTAVTPIPYTIVLALTYSILSQSVAVVLVALAISNGHVSWAIGFLAAVCVVCALIAVVGSWLKLGGFNPAPCSEEYLHALEIARVFFSAFLLPSYVLAELCLYATYTLIHSASATVAVPLLSIPLTLPFPYLILRFYVGILHGGDQIIFEHLQPCWMVQLCPDLLKWIVQCTMEAAETLGGLGSGAIVSDQDPDHVYPLPLYYPINKAEEL